MRSGRGVAEVGAGRQSGRRRELPGERGWPRHRLLFVLASLQQQLPAVDQQGSEKHHAEAEQVSSRVVELCPRHQQRKHVEAASFQVGGVLPPEQECVLERLVAVLVRRVRNMLRKQRFRHADELTTSEGQPNRPVPFGTAAESVVETADGAEGRNAGHHRARPEFTKGIPGTTSVQEDLVDDHLARGDGLGAPGGPDNSCRPIGKHNSAGGVAGHELRASLPFPSDQGPVLLRETLRVTGIVVVKIRQELSGSLIQQRIAGSGTAAILVVPEKADPGVVLREFGNDFRRLVHGTIIDYENLEIRPVLRASGFDGSPDGLPGIEAGNANGDGGNIHGFRWRLVTSGRPGRRNAGRCCMARPELGIL